MSYDRQSSTCTASTNTSPPKALAPSRNPGSQTYSAFIEKAEIFDSCTAMEPPIRYSRRAPSKRFYCSIIIGQLLLICTVVALVLTAVSYTRARQSDRASYIVWLVISGSATLLMAFLTVIFWYQRRKLRALQVKLQGMQIVAEARDSQKRLDTPSAAAPQLHAETDRRLSVVAQRHFEAVEAVAGAEPTRRASVSMAKTTNRRRNISSTAGEGCELSLFQTHLSNGSSDLVTSPSSAQIPSQLHISPLQRSHEHESAASHFWNHEPTMMDIQHSTAVQNHDFFSQTCSLAAPSRCFIFSKPLSPAPWPRKKTVTLPSHRRVEKSEGSEIMSPHMPSIVRCHSTPSVFSQQEHRSRISGAIHDTSDPAAAAFSSTITAATSTSCFRSRATSTASSSPDYGILLPAFPLPPSHTKFSGPSLAPLAQESKVEPESKASTVESLPPLERMNMATEQQQQQQDRTQNENGKEERNTCGHVVGAMVGRRMKVKCAAGSSEGERGKNAGEERERGKRKGSEADGPGPGDGSGGGDTYLELRSLVTPASVDDGRRDSHVDPDQQSTHHDDDDRGSSQPSVGTDNERKQSCRRPTLPRTQRWRQLPSLATEHRSSVWHTAPQGTKEDQLDCTAATDLNLFSFERTARAETTPWPGWTLISEPIREFYQR